MSTAREKYHESLGELFNSIAAGKEKWQRPWKEGEIKLPFNATTGKEYTGCNSLFFSSENRNAGFLTFLQIKNLGLSLRKGARGIRGFKVLTFEETKEVEDQKEKKQKRWGIKAFTVFSCADVSGPGSEKLVPAITDTVPSFASFLKEVKKRGLAIKEQSGGKERGAFYSSTDNAVYMPAKEDFRTSAHFRTTLLHEISHWAIRHQVPPGSLSFNPGRYHADTTERAKEEITVEMAAYILSGKLGVEHEPTENMSAYIRSWGDDNRQPHELARELVGDTQKVVTALEPYIEKAKQKARERERENELSL